MIYHSKSGVVLCWIRLFPTLISKIKWLGSELPLKCNFRSFEDEHRAITDLESLIRTAIESSSPLTKQILIKDCFKIDESSKMESAQPHPNQDNVNNPSDIEKYFSQLMRLGKIR